MRLPMFNTTGDALRSACRWIAPFTGFWSPALLVRAGKLSDLTEGEFLSRTAVASMEPTLAVRLYIWCRQILERELAVPSGSVNWSSAQESLLEVLSEVLSRLAFRLDIAELKASFSLLLSLNSQAGTRANTKLWGLCGSWFQRLFEAADTELLAEWLPTLLKAPLLDESVKSRLPAYPIPPDPMRAFPSQRLRHAKHISTEHVARINDATDWLIRRAASESNEARSRAIERLAHLCHASLMSDAQRQQFGALLWAETRAGGLPERHHSAVSAFLYLPAPEGTDVHSAVKSFILGLPSRNPSGRDASGQTVVTFGLSSRSVIFEASHASKPVVRLMGESLGGVEWTHEEAKQLYFKARDEWTNEKRALEIARDSPFFPTTSPNFDALGEFLARAILPHMVWADEEVWEQLFTWLQELQGSDVFPSVALPYVLLHRPAEADNMAKTIAADIDSDFDSRVAAAAAAIRHWIHLGAAGLVPQPPAGLLNALIERVIFRRKPGVKSCLWHLACLIVERQDSIALSNAALLSSSLLPWHRATILRTPEEGFGDFLEAERPGVRTGVAGLAGALRKWYATSAPSEREPPSIANWQELCSSEPLPEIRRAFEQWDEIK